MYITGAEMISELSIVGNQRSWYSIETAFAALLKTVTLGDKILSYHVLIQVSAWGYLLTPAASDHRYL